MDLAQGAGRQLIGKNAAAGVAMLFHGSHAIRLDVYGDLSPPENFEGPDLAHSDGNPRERLDLGEDEARFHVFDAFVFEQGFEHEVGVVLHVLHVNA